MVSLASVRQRRLRILDLDLENRPLSYLGPDFNTDEITSIAWSWVGSRAVGCFLLKSDGDYFDGTKYYTPGSMLQEISAIISSADMVTGHFIRRHDLPEINAACIENGLLPLPELLVQDTKLDLVRQRGMSMSQENLGQALGIPTHKQHMSQVDWREANRLTPRGLELTRTRVTKDVIMHKQMRECLVQQGLLRAPRLWEP